MAKKTPDSPDSPRSFTDTKRVKELIALMADNGLSEIELVEDKSRILLRRGGGAMLQMAAPMQAHFPQAAAQTPAPVAAGHGSAAASTPPPAAESNLVAIKSPMVGIFYAASGPEAPAYVSIGSSVDEKSVVCIIEAMKHFNDIYAETRGTITKILVSNGQVVEFGQPLFMVKPH